MNISDPVLRYHEYLRSFGVVDAGDRVAELRDLDLGVVRFFAYVSGDDGLRLKAAVTPAGVVTPGGRTGDDWYGFLARMPDGSVAAERIAWLETDASTSPHGLPSPPTAMLTPDRPLPTGIDPAQWALVAAPVLSASRDGSVTLVAWFLASGARVPVRWTVASQPSLDAVIERVSAQELLLASVGSESATAGRARSLLASGTDDQRWWALQHIGDSGDRAFVPDVAALLADAAASPTVRLQAAGTLARLADPAAVAALGVALRSDAAPEVRRACAQALGRLNGSSAVQALTQAAPDEPNVTVRAEIVHALAAQGSVAHDALARIARSDPDPTIRDLARGSIDATQQHER